MAAAGLGLSVVAILGEIGMKAAASTGIHGLVDMADIPKNLDFLHYMALGMVSYGAKYSHKVWEQFAHAFEN